MAVFGSRQGSGVLLTDRPGPAARRGGRGQDDPAVAAGRPHVGPHPGRGPGPAERPGPPLSYRCAPCGPWRRIPGPGGAVRCGRTGDPEGVDLSVEEHTQLLQRIAVWLVREGQSEFTREQALRQPGRGTRRARRRARRAARARRDHRSPPHRLYLGARPPGAVSAPSVKVLSTHAPDHGEDLGVPRPLFPGLSRPLPGRLRPAHAGSRTAALLAGLAGAGHRAAPAASDRGGGAGRPARRPVRPTNARKGLPRTGRKADSGAAPFRHALYGSHASFVRFGPAPPAACSIGGTSGRADFSSPRNENFLSSPSPSTPTTTM